MGGMLTVSRARAPSNQDDGCIYVELLQNGDRHTPCRATALSFAAVPARALDDQQKKEMGAFIREYLLANPEVLLEVQDALEKKQRDMQFSQAANGIVAHKEAIFSSPSDITLGNPKGDVTIVEFFDYNCTYCKRALGDMDKILSKDKQVRFILKEFPILGRIPWPRIVLPMRSG